MRVAEFDALGATDAEPVLLRVCESGGWAAGVVAGRPYGTLTDLLDAADAALDALPDSEFDAALAGHPRIGERTERAQSRLEQAGVDEADTATLTELAALGAEYERRHGMVYLVHASGRSGTDLLDLLRGRVDNDTATERRTAREELATINRNRLRQMFAPDGRVATHEGDAP
ncbi:2-oxo-4-hydroxy-4-carboxy-5-ureidoimidazoline decarboxylase [Rhodococcus sp. Q]|uniref:2-oxo-4-hydroxy-4-carboxy-5-ureidoimidazoline decarboxylase n=1 Tax=Rhodococcus sp. Q TaxID=2502252 RepID=UPI0010F91918|nr:2-oxo-4-hydroxy-4-carboxy-5-ureidoimidazoline decarboxylase [Rhodococcus sp. Q]